MKESKSRKTLGSTNQDNIRTYKLQTQEKHKGNQDQGKLKKLGTDRRTKTDKVTKREGMT